MPETKKRKVLRGIMKSERRFEWKARNIDREIDEETGRRVIYVKINKVTTFDDGSKTPTNFVENNIRLRSRRYLQAQMARNANSGSGSQEEASLAGGSGRAEVAPLPARGAPDGEAPVQVNGGDEEAPKPASGSPPGGATSHPEQKMKKLRICLTKFDARI